MSHQDRRAPLPADYQYQPWKPEGRILRDGEQMLSYWGEYRTSEEAEAGLSTVKAALVADAESKGLEAIGHGNIPVGAYSCRIEDGIRLAVVNGPIERDNFVAHASAFYVPRTHGVDCDCPTCRNRVTEQDYWKETDEILRRGLANMAASQMANTIREDRLRAALAPTQTAYGWGV